VGATTAMLCALLAGMMAAVAVARRHAQGNTADVRVRVSKGSHLLKG
jgi:hypothetical protein